MQYKSDWEWLGIPPTTDILTIKKAFAAKTKEYHPEENPGEFMALQKAYKSAVAYAKSANGSAQPVNDLRREHMQEGVTLSIPQFWGTAEPEIKEDEGLGEDANGGNPGQNDFTGQAVGGRSSDKTEEAEDRFDYGEIARREQEQTEQRFFCGFTAIAENPNICQNEKIWRTFLRTEEFQPYFESEDFCLKFLEAIAGRGYLQREIAQIFRERLQHNAAVGAMLRKEAGAYAAFHPVYQKRYEKAPKKMGRMAKRKIHLPDISKGSREVQALHQIVLRRARLSGLSTDVNTWQGAAQYLEIYLPYAADNLAKIQKIGRSSRRAAKMVDALVALGCLVMAAALVVNVWVLPRIRQRNSVPVLQEQFEENLERESLFDDSLVPDSEDDRYLTDMEEVLTDMLDRYENWQGEGTSDTEAI